MRQSNDELTQHVAARWCWEVARRDDTRVARRLHRKQEVDGVYRLDDGAVLEDCFQFLRTIGVMALREEAHGAAIQRAMVPDGQDWLALRPEDRVRHQEHACAAPRIV